MAIYFNLGHFVSIFLFLHLASTQNDSFSEDTFQPFEGNRYDAFDWDILKQLDAPENGNVIISPLSVKILMAILNEGLNPRSNTAKEMQPVLDFRSNITIVRDRFKTILDSIKANSKAYDLNIESRVYLDSNYVYRRNFTNIVKSIYDADTKVANLSDSSRTAEDINKWVNDVTAGRITDMVSEDDLNKAALVLLNAVYFRGKWRYQFPKNKTTKGGFYLANQKSVTVDYMTNEGEYLYQDSTELDAKILRMPYKDSHISMFIILPNSKAGLQRLIKNINSGELKRQQWFMYKQKVEVIMPKFHFTYKARFNKIFQKLGIQRIFDNSADFENIVRGGRSKKMLSVSNILQKAGIQVDEEGSVAYASTEIQLTNKFGSPDYIFNVSNPFMFYIEDEQTGTVLFAGKVENPVEREPAPFPSELDSVNRFGNTPTVAPPISTLTDGFQMNLNPTQQENSNLLNYKKFHYFDMELFKAVVTKSNQNVVVSPTSVKQVLAMVLEGAAGQCADELRHALRLPNDQKAIRDLFDNISSQYLEYGTGVTFKSANHLFITNRDRLQDAYQYAVSQYYHSGVTSVDFSDSYQTAYTINEWISRETQGLIPTLITQDSVMPQTSLILANALYFKGMWEKAFNEDNTRTACFQTETNSCYSTNMMESTDNYKFAEIRELDAKALEIPYKNNKYAMLIILPNRMTGMTRMINDLPYEYDDIVRSLQVAEVQVQLPRFSFEYYEDMVRNLEEVKVTEIFSEQKANLSHIISGKTDSRNLFISNVFHKAKVEVNEQGTIAAASTGAVVIPLMGSTKPRFRADHPFVFFIRHVELQTILFAGRVSYPEKAEDGIQQTNRRGFVPERVQVVRKPVEEQIVFERDNQPYVSPQQTQYNPKYVQPQETRQPQVQPQYQSQSDQTRIIQEQQRQYTQETQRRQYSDTQQPEYTRTQQNSQSFVESPRRSSQTSSSQQYSQPQQQNQRERHSTQQSRSQQYPNQSDDFAFKN